uniref:Uncharacterized protein n=1 Tax=Trichuris muris TaxID=70415 RepID=A0A5S6Q6B9_TRIMR
MEWTGEEDDVPPTKGDVVHLITVRGDDWRSKLNCMDSTTWLIAAAVGLFSAAAGQDDQSVKAARFMKALTRRCTLEALCGKEAFSLCAQTSLLFLHFGENCHVLFRFLSKVVALSTLDKVNADKPRLVHVLQ